MSEDVRIRFSQSQRESRGVFRLLLIRRSGFSRENKLNVVTDFCARLDDI